MAVKKQTFDYEEAAEKTKATRRKQNATAVQQSEASSDTNTTSSVRTKSPEGTNVNTEQIGIRITKDMKRSLKRFAVDNDTTINNIVRNLLENLLNGTIELSKNLNG